MLLPKVYHTAVRCGCKPARIAREAAALREQLEKMRNKEARREERAAQQAAAKEEADKAE